MAESDELSEYFEQNSIENLDAVRFMGTLGAGSAQLIWTDPPYGTGKVQALNSNGVSYQDSESPLPLLKRLGPLFQRALSPTGVLVLCLDYRSVHEAIVLYGKHFTYWGDIIWFSELGGISKTRWSQKHHTMAIFSKGPKPKFDFEQVPLTLRKSRVEDFGNTKKLTSVWTFTMSNSDRQRVGYPSQKPLEIICPFIQVHTSPGDLVVDPFAGSGSVGEAAIETGRRFAINDINPVAYDVMCDRLLDAQMYQQWREKDETDG